MNPTSRPDLRLDEIRKVFYKTADMKKWWFYDTLRFKRLAANEAWYVFQNIQGKPFSDCNLAQPRRLLSGQRAWLDGISVVFDREVFGEPWVQDLYIRFAVNGLAVISGPVANFQRYMLNPEKMPDTMAALVVDEKYIAFSMAFSRPVFLSEHHDFDAVMTNLGGEAVLDQPVTMRVVLHGLLLPPPGM